MSGAGSAKRDVPAEDGSTPSGEFTGPFVDKDGVVIVGTKDDGSPEARSLSMLCLPLKCNYFFNHSILAGHMRRQTKASTVAAQDARTVSAAGLGLLPPDVAGQVGGLVKTVGGIVNGLPAPVGPLVGGIVNGLGDTVVGLLGRDVDTHSLRSRSPATSDDDCDEDPECDEDDGHEAPHGQGHTRRAYMPYPQLPGEAVPGFASVWGSSAQDPSTIAASAYDTVSSNGGQIYGATPASQIYGYPTPFDGSSYPGYQSLPAPVSNAAGSLQGQQQSTQYEAHSDDHSQSNRGGADQSRAQASSQFADVFPGQLGGPVSGMLGTVQGGLGTAQGSVPHRNAIIGFLPNGMPVFGQVADTLNGVLQGTPVGGLLQGSPVGGLLQGSPVGGILNEVQNSVGGGVRTVGGLLDGLHLPVGGNLLGSFNVEGVPEGAIPSASLSLPTPSGTPASLPVAPPTLLTHVSGVAPNIASVGAEDAIDSQSFDDKGSNMGSTESSSYTESATPTSSTPSSSTASTEASPLATMSASVLDGDATTATSSSTSASAPAYTTTSAAM